MSKQYDIETQCLKTESRLATHDLVIEYIGGRGFIARLYDLHKASRYANRKQAIKIKQNDSNI
jgi:hypothetical protein